MTNDLETAARELAEKSVERYNHKDAWIQYEMRKCGKLSFEEGFLAGAAHNQKRIEELEAELVGLTKLNETLASYANAGESLERALTKERKISKMLEEGLKDADFVLQGSCAIDGQSDELLDKRENALMRFFETLAEVQKLRGE